MSKITVRYFAAAAEAAGRDAEVLEFASELPSLDDLRSDLVARYGDAIARVLKSGSFLVNGTVRRDGGALVAAGTETGPNDEHTVDVLPAFAGG
ncbi:MoaD/ThiS family protein [Leucobacter sp. cx-328]|uniref:MoaD/ThiS family protein n=1 Tax=unclassified Leucobacter TaxID=2621730 RepID=UPI00165E95B9|nr:MULTISPECIES: MoaD/ThiS family protein [unclassified Leucobacter]MBC9944233.1 MoaD/ThiS family protein [Leucobacter sp. cx-328]